MFCIAMAKSFKIGDTADCRINGQKARLHWRDADHLVIEPDDVRPILAINREGDLTSFMCGDAGSSRANYNAEMGTDGILVSELTPDEQVKTSTAKPTSGH
jgi:hypothetical protein